MDFRLVLLVVAVSLATSLITSAALLALAFRLRWGVGLRWPGFGGGKPPRPRRRYIVFEIASESRVECGDLERALRETIKSVYGLRGLEESGARLVYCNPATRRGVVRVRHAYRDLALSSLGLVRRVGSLKVALIPVKTTGTLKKAIRVAST